MPSSSTRIAVSLLVLVLLLLCGNTAVAFTTPKIASSSRSRFMGQTMTFTPTPVMRRQHQQSSSLSMFLGTDGGILGVGTPEVFTILLVGYFVLGPSDLYKLVKEIGKSIQSIRSLGTEATKSFESTMESQLAVDELRKAQRELNDAFSFRRSINIDQESETFNTVDETRAGLEPMIASKVAGEAGEEGSEAIPGKPKKRIRRRKKKVVVEEEVPAAAPFNGDGTIPDLDMSAAFDDAPPPPLTEEQVEEEATRAERMERLASGQPEGAEPPSDWFLDENKKLAEERALQSPEESAAEANRFATQLGGGWNDQILENEDALGPLAVVMEKLALLEEERAAADSRLQEEFQLRTDLEEKYYRKKRAILEEAAAEVQAEAYNLSTTTTTTTGTAAAAAAAAEE